MTKTSRRLARSAAMHFNSARSSPSVALALQGGGAHGAFTWGVLDALLERGVAIAALSGASAGAMNAVVCAHGLMQGGAEGARRALEAFWLAVAQRVPPLWHMPGDPPSLSPTGRAVLAWTRWFAPAQLNPLGINPMRDLLIEQVDFERLRSGAGPALFIAATEAQTARCRLFRRPDLTHDALLASACLPTLAHPVVIDGRALWDGAFSANPPLVPLVRETGADDLVLVTLSPLRARALPTDARGIGERMLDIAFAAPLLSEARWLAQAQADARGAWWPRAAHDRRLARLRWHLLDADDTLAGLPGETRLLPDCAFVERLRDAGRERVDSWWTEHGNALGRRSSLDVQAAFGETLDTDTARGKATHRAWGLRGSL
jgi:NTE family protein